MEILLIEDGKRDDYKFQNLIKIAVLSAKRSSLLVTRAVPYRKRGNRIALKEPSNTKALENLLHGSFKTQKERLLSLKNHCTIMIEMNDFTKGLNYTTNQKFYCSTAITTLI